jgi:hypothetical protein
MGKVTNPQWSKLRNTGRWSQAQARWVLGELGRSGLGVKEFAVRHAIGAHRIYYWRERLEAAEGSAPRLVEVQVSDTARQPMAPAPRIEVELLSGRRLSISETVDPRRLEALVMALEGRGC